MCVNKSVRTCVKNLISGRIPLLFQAPRKVRNTASLGSRGGHRKRFLKFTQAGKIPHCAHQRLYILFPKPLHIICNCLNLKRRSLICRLRYKQRRRIWNGFADNQHRQNQICKQADSFPVSSDSENFQNSAEQSLLFLPKYIVLFSSGRRLKIRFCSSTDNTAIPFFSP